jgi:hypothetical protein
MNNKTILGIVFLLAGTLLTSTMAMVQAYAEDDNDDKRHDDDKRYGNGGDGNKQKVEDDSAGAIADCDKNEVEDSDFDCIAAAATDESEVGTGDGDGDDNGDGDPETCEECLDEFLGELSDADEAAVSAEIGPVVGACDLELEVLIDTIEEVLGEGEATELEACIEALAVIV